MPIDELGAGEQQLVEIMRALYYNPRLLLLDEPTASLGEGEIAPFLNFVRQLRDELGVTVVFISHKLEEVFEVCDRVITLTDGHKTMDSLIADTSIDECISAMLRNVQLEAIPIQPPKYDELPVVLDIKDGEYDGALHNFNIKVHAGEVFGCYGLVGAGRTEWAEHMFGLRKSEKRSFVFSGETITNCTPKEMIDRGFILTPERRGNGIYKTFSLTDNVCNLYLDSGLSGKLGLVKRKESVELTRKVIESFNVKYKNINQNISELSGGNIQKIMLGRSVFLKDIKLLIADEPTTGMDVGAKNDLHIHLRKLAEDQKIAVIIISSEVEELLKICDRICVFNEGNAIQTIDRPNFVKHDIVEIAIKGRVK